ncbi:hypothetical protein THRCLA_09981 [Thraustotheca clavata]|uniref:Uncharacterized protein n=1 Tax=Thraustotheca clavata TaxID=74557 RepID=A0A1V9YTC3_9STRA|nr:hypothetical protein THRCLA_09981 [Thraustotheca clavata]
MMENEFLLGPLELLSANRWVPITLVYPKMLNREALCSALQATLNQNPIFAGRLQWKVGKAFPAAKLKVVVDPTMCGILFTTSISSMKLKDIIVDENTTSWRSRSQLTKQFMAAPHAMTMHKMIKESTSLVYITLTQLDGGSILCVEFAHCIGDGSTFYHFLKHLSQASTLLNFGLVNELNIQASPFHLVYEAVNLVPANVPVWLFVGPKPREQSPNASLSHELMVNTKVFWFTQSQMERIKTLASKNSIVSSNDALTALLWKLSSFLPTQNSHYPFHLRVLINFRSAFSPPLPLNSIGNMVYSAIVKGAPATIISEMDIASLASICRQSIEAGRANVVNDLAIVYKHASCWSKVYWNDPPEEHNITSVTSLAAFNFVALEFPCQDTSSVSALEQLESPFGGFQNFFQVFTDARGGYRVVAHLSPRTMPIFEERLKLYLVRSAWNENY